jgi:putative ABC transport system permease protein
VQFSYKNILRRPTRSALTISGVAIAVAALVGFVSVAGSFQRALLASFEGRGVDLIVAGGGTLQRMQSSLDEDLGEKIRALPGVKRVAAGLAEHFAYESLDGAMGIVTRGVEPDSLLLDELSIVDGRSLQADDERAILLGKMTAAALDKKVGDRFDVVPGESFDVVGVYDTFNLMENNSMIMPLATLQRLMDRQGKVTIFTVIAQRSDRETLLRLASAIRGLAPNLDVLPAREYVDSMIEVRLARAMAWITSVLALILGTIGMINTMLTAVFERTREIAVLRAVGWRKSSVVRLILLESGLMGLVGAVAGVLLAWSLTQVLSHMPAGRLISGEIDPVVIVQGVVLAMAVGLVGGLYPAYRAARLLPTEGLRHE